jgi:hypothetical protein
MTTEQKIEIAIEISQEIQSEYVKKYGAAGSEKYHAQMQAEIKEAVEYAIHDAEREERRDIEMSRFYGDDDYYDPYAYQQDLIDMHRFER